MSEIPDNFEINMQFLEKVHNIDEVATRVMNGIDLVINGGTEGMRAVAIAKPSEFLASFVNIKILIGIQQDLIKKLVDENSEIMDRVEALVRNLPENGGSSQ